MNKQILLWIAGLLFCVPVLLAQDISGGVAAAFKKGSSEALSLYLGDQVDLMIQNRPTKANHQVAADTMEAFFTDHKVSGFNVNHQGKRDESSFIIGTLNTASGVFRVNCFFKKIESKYLIHQIRIDKTND
ncbi:MAG: DUF4783 domain-containing protein [Bacteroides sp.]